MWTDRQADRHIDMTKLIVAFHNFANAPYDAHVCAFAVTLRQNAEVWTRLQRDLGL